MMPAEFNAETAMKMAQWEKAKGELRALVAMQGCYMGGGREAPETQRWLEVERRVESFIKQIEDEALQE
jgi:hypothetical protein